MARRQARGIPLQVRVSRALARGERYLGELSVDELPRLRAAVGEQPGRIAVELDARRDGQGQDRLSGRIDCHLTLTCQRGLHPFAWSAQVPVDVQLVTSEQDEKRLLAKADPVRVDGDVLALRELVEDEVMLALPMMPRCEDPTCVGNLAPDRKAARG